MGNFNKNFKRREYSGDTFNKTMFKAVCAQCGKDCEVPFKPNGTKPVLCSECFGKDSKRSFNNDYKNEGRQSPYERKHSYGRDEQSHLPSNKAQFEELNAKLDMIIKLIGKNNH